MEHILRNFSTYQQLQEKFWFYYYPIRTFQSYCVDLWKCFSAFWLQTFCRCETLFYKKMSLRRVRKQTRQHEQADPAFFTWPIPTSDAQKYCSKTSSVWTMGIFQTAGELDRTVVELGDRFPVTTAVRSMHVGVPSCAIHAIPFCVVCGFRPHWEGPIVLFLSCR